MPRGVDLNLDQFNLSVAAEAGSWAGTVEAPEGAEHLGVNAGAFWSNLDNDSTTILNGHDKELFRNVFNTNLSDRRQEGDDFVPPATSLSYMHKLKNLIKEEAIVRQKRKEVFFSKEFVKDNAGSLFPLSWSSSVELEQENKPATSLRARPDFKAEESLLEEVLRSTVPEFEKCTEDGTKFLIYRLGSLEVRATQERDAQVVIGAVFSTNGAEGLAPATRDACQRIQDDEAIVKVSHYVERALHGKLRCQSYVVIETKGGHRFVTEKLRDGTALWKEDPEDLSDRNSLAKVVCAAECNQQRVTVGEVRGHWAREAARPKARSLPAMCKRYAQAAYRVANGEPREEA